VILEREEPVDEGVSTRRGRGAGDSILVDLLPVGLLGFMTSKYSDMLVEKELLNSRRRRKNIYINLIPGFLETRRCKRAREGKPKNT